MKGRRLEEEKEEEERNLKGNEVKNRGGRSEKEQGKKGTERREREESVGRKEGGERGGD